MKLKIELSTDNAAFSPNIGLEISRILGSYANSIKDVLDDGTNTWELETTLRDLNGNKVGNVVYVGN
tara:strand:+ start:1039 stop:1239 length:201 start_codon:yes stop_codon:yes gene_type:complete